MILFDWKKKGPQHKDSEIKEGTIANDLYKKTKRGTREVIFRV